MVQRKLVEDKIESILSDLEHKGWSVQEHFFSSELIQTLRRELHELQQQGNLKQAGIGREKNLNIEQSIRGDEIYWLDKNNPTSAQHEYFNITHKLQNAINQRFYLGLHELEVHFALYAKDAFYKRHLDQHKNQDTRVLSVITYLNENWAAENGGELQLYLKSGQMISIMPDAGTFVCFMSAEFEHEVLPAKHTRASLTGWFRKRPA